MVPLVLPLNMIMMTLTSYRGHLPFKLLLVECVTSTESPSYKQPVHICKMAVWGQGMVYGHEMEQSQLGRMWIKPVTLTSLAPCSAQLH